MSEYNDRLDQERLDRMLDDEFAPARVDDWREDDMGVQGMFDEQPRVFSGPLEELRELKIAAKECPMPGCAGTLDDSFFCYGCGNVSLPKPPKDEKAAA